MKNSLHILDNRLERVIFKTPLSFSRHLYFLRHLSTFSRRMFKIPHLFSRDHRYNQDTLLFFKRPGKFSRHIFFFKRHCCYFQETKNDIKTHSYFQETKNDIKTHSYFSRDIDVLKRRLERCLELTSWKCILENRLENRPIFSRRFSKTPICIFKTPFQDAGVLKRCLDRCLESIASWKTSQASWRILFLRCDSGQASLQVETKWR